MPLWDKVKQELDRAGQVAQDAIDEGRIRLEAQRARRLADRAARVLGYAVYRARQSGATLDEAELARHAEAAARHDAESDRLEAQVRAIQDRWRAPGARSRDAGSTAGASSATGRPDPIDPSPAPPASATTAPPPETGPTAATVDATKQSTIEVDPWRPNAGPGSGTI